jgi:hypothetical protein
VSGQGIGFIRRVPLASNGTSRLVVRHFRCNCGKEEFDYLAPEADPKDSSVSVGELLRAIGVKEGDVLVVTKERPERIRRDLELKRGGK